MNTKDYATSTVLTAPSPATSGTSLTVQSGHGARFPTSSPFFITAHPATETPTLDNAEKLLVTDVTGDVLTIVRAQGDTTAKSIGTGWRVSSAIFTDDVATHAGILNTFCPLPKITFNLPLDSGAHDYYQNSGSVAHDDSVKAQGTASLRVITDGAANFDGGQYDLVGEPLDWTNKRFRIWVRSDNWNEVDLATILISTSGFFDSFFFCHVNLGISSPQNDEWMELYLDAHNFAEFGTPDWTTVNKVLFRVLDKGNEPVTVWYDSFGVFDRGDAGYISITFDDGWDNVYDNAKPVLDEFGIRTTQFIIPEVLGEGDRMTEDEIDEFHRDGHEISGHGATSLVDLEIANGIEYVDEYLRYVKNWLERRGYRGQDLWAYPNGNHTKEIQDTVLKYFSVARALAMCGQPSSAVNPRHVSARTVSGTSDTAAGLIAEIDQAIANQDWLILVFHRIVPSVTFDTEFATGDFRDVIEHIYNSGYNCFPMGEVLRRLR